MSARERECVCYVCLCVNGGNGVDVICLSVIVSILAMVEEADVKSLESVTRSAMDG